jgi:hypothetical protein
VLRVELLARMQVNALRRSVRAGTCYLEFAVDHVARCANTERFAVEVDDGDVA